MSAGIDGNHGPTLMRLFDCWTRSDVEGALTDMANDVVFEPDPKGTRHEGVAALRVLWTKYMAMMHSYEWRAISYLEGDGIAMLEREEVVGVTGKELRLPIMAVFRFDASGKITAWRDYWDSAMAAPH